MSGHEKINILLVDDQPAKLLSYEVILEELGETLLVANSAREALEHLLRTDVAVILIDVCMPELDGFELAAMIREHPRFQKTAIIFVSAVMLSEPDRLRGYEAGAVDYVPVPIVPEVLRAKVRVFGELYRKTRALESVNEELEQRVAERTASLAASNSKLVELENRRSLALAAARMGSWDVDLTTGACIWDEGQKRIMGCDGDSACDFLSFVLPEDRAAFERGWVAAQVDGTIYDLEFRIRRPDGSVRWCMLSAAATGDDGAAVRLSGVTQDITDRKEAEQALLRVNEELERRIEERTQQRAEALSQLFEAQKLDTIGQLTGGIAHDFNNLLMAVLGSLELLKKRIGKDPAAVRLLDNAVQGAERGTALTQRLLAFARRQELKPEPVNLGSLAEGMLGLLERAVGPGVRILVDLPSHLPPVQVDPNQLELALLNLAVNARDAMPSGGALSISAHVETIEAKHGLAPGSYMRVRIQDTGIGMDEQTLAKATEPFFTTKGVGKGTGLGLSMVHGLAAQSGGLLRIQSTPGQGTVVELWLPCAFAAPARETPAEVAAPAPAPSERAYAVLIVDDDALVRLGTAAMLEDLGHRILEARSGAEALTLLDAHPDVDLVITDQAMPGMSGLELAKEIRDQMPDMPIILATGYAEMPAGVGPSVVRLGKPFRQAELAAAISRTLQA
ncbi:MAG TPA: response regulator [Beijerinckiaceae bacterium]